MSMDPIYLTVENRQGFLQILFEFDGNSGMIRNDQEWPRRAALGIYTLGYVSADILF